MEAVDALANRRIRIAGYAYPLAFEFEGVERAIFGPPPGPCPHAPPPPPNQLILLEVAGGTDIGMDPVFVTGVLQIGTYRTGYLITRYFVRAETVEPAVIGDVK